MYDGQIFDRFEDLINNNWKVILKKTATRWMDRINKNTIGTDETSINGEQKLLTW